MKQARLQGPSHVRSQAHGPAPGQPCQLQPSTLLAMRQPWALHPSSLACSGLRQSCRRQCQHTRAACRRCLARTRSRARSSSRAVTMGVGRLQHRPSVATSKTHRDSDSRDGRPRGVGTGERGQGQPPSGQLGRQWGSPQLSPPPACQGGSWPESVVHGDTHPSHPSSQRDPGPRGGLDQTRLLRVRRSPGPRGITLACGCHGVPASNV